MRINLRSIESFSRHSQSASSDHTPREAIACLSPVLIKPKKCFCGLYFLSESPLMSRLRFSVNTGPCLTAKTPDLGRGDGMEAISPTAKIFECDVLRRYSST